MSDPVAAAIAMLIFFSASAVLLWAYDVNQRKDYDE